MTTKKRLGVPAGALIIVLLALLLSACGGSNWNKADLTEYDKFGETVQCHEIDTASETLETAVKDNDGVALTQMGVWIDGKLDDAILKDARDNLNKWRTECSKGTPTVTSTATSSSNTDSGVPSDGDAGVRDSDGQLRPLPLVDQRGDGVTPVNSTGDPRSPATYQDAMKCSPVRNWAEFVNCIGDQQWYKDGVDARSSKTGFTWSDIEKWAKETDIDTRVIQVYNLEISDADARNQVRSLVGNDADKLPIARHACIVNTRGLEGNRMEDFVDCRKMVRVSLSPIVYKDNRPVSLRADTGIFVDCFNLWWIPQEIVKHGQPPAPRGTGGNPPPGTTVPPGTGGPPPPVTTTTPNDDKIPSQAATHDGGRGTVTAPVSPPTGGPAVPTYTTQPRPTVQPTQPPVTTEQPQPTGQPVPTVAPSTQPPKNSVVPTTGGEFG